MDFEEMMDSENQAKLLRATGLAQRAAKKSLPCHLSQIRLDWTNSFVKIVIEKDSNLSEGIIDKIKHWPNFG